MTTVREQAERWARRKANILGIDTAIVNLYQMDDNTDGLLVKSFDEDLTEWIDFVCRCRGGEEDYLKYDQIAFVRQKAIDRLLQFESFEEV